MIDNKTPVSASCTVPEAPTNLRCMSVMDTNVTLEWTPPVNPNGDIMYYSINVTFGPGSPRTVNTTKPVQIQEIDKLTEGHLLNYKLSLSILLKPNLTSSCSMNLKTMVAITDSGLTNESFVQTIEGLSPYVSYSVLVNAITGAGDGYSGAVTVETNEEAPQNLTQVSADVLNSTAIKLSWSIQDPRPGKTTYTIYLYDVINEKQALNKSIEVLGFYKRSTILTNLEEYWQYVINIKASTNKGQSAMKNVIPEKTQPAAPGKVANFMVSRPEGNYKSATITWSIPSLRDQNSLITSYEFKHNATGTPASKILSQSVNNGDGFTESIEVQPENYYYIEVYAINNQNQTGVKSSELYYAPPGPPPKLDSSPDIKVIQNDIKSPSTETTATILLYQNQFTANENGQIINNGIILCPKETQITTQRQYTDYDKFTTWNEAKKDEFSQCYKPTNSSWLQNSKKVTVRKRSTDEHISYTIGEDTTCDKKSENSYCNGPLKPGKSYQAYTFVCTRGGCTESQAIVITTVEQPPPIPFAIIGGVIGALVVIIIVLVVVIVLKKRKAPFQLQDCAARDIKTLSPKHPTEAAEMDQNRLKNRYVNILPFDHSRVKLLPIDDDESTDFINANYLPGYNSPREYIGTQGPIPGTIDDFWRMVWEQNVGIIVMLTLLKEEGRIKCEEYWPMERNDPKQYGELVVETTSYSTVNFYDFRIFKIKLVGSIAGVGRTGTYICLDHLMQLINEHDLNTAIDIFDLVLKLRDNRSFMVQTEQQYVFIHDCVKDMIEKKKLALQDQGDEDLYMNQDENLYENRAFEAEENLYQNVDTRTDL
ncbi:hypothetical protein KUTeg_007327 [Tegillarca granosa]|uniref:protein-tyrosine-phosphatase n=1 Tax=Tegillarca granosa TaxID=220873 RepID=A0ABQ9FH32_TEGGR|nr:hypothetical protein KUTeg_007327 [Tegillarca granosa]